MARIPQRSEFEIFSRTGRELHKALIITEFNSSLANRYPKTNRWLNQCYNQPPLNDIRIAICNEILGGHGIESFDLPTNGKSYFLYVNMGDMYVATIGYSSADDMFYVGTYEDFIKHKTLGI